MKQNNSRRKVGAYQLLQLTAEAPHDAVVKRYWEFLGKFDLNRKESLAELGAFVLIYENRQLPPHAGSPVALAMDRLNNEQLEVVFKMLNRPATVRPSMEWMETQHMALPWVNPPLLYVPPTHVAPPAPNYRPPAPPQQPVADKELDFEKGDEALTIRKCPQPLSSKGWILPTMGLLGAAGVVTAIALGGSSKEKPEEKDTVPAKAKMEAPPKGEKKYQDGLKKDKGKDEPGKKR